MRGSVLADTGPLVALASQRDQYHELCLEQVRKLPPQVFTSWPVITEAAWLLRDDPEAIQRLLTTCDRGPFRLLPLDQAAARWTANFLKRYRKLKAQVADASLVYLAEREGIETIFTLDRRDFSVYRLSDGRSLRLLPEII